jgi:hypothetical protein
MDSCAADHPLGHTPLDPTEEEKAAQILATFESYGLELDLRSVTQLCAEHGWRI